MIALENISLEVRNSINHFPSFYEVMLRKKRTEKSFFILNNLSLKIHAGERVGILGVNGSGKTSLLRLIAGSYFPTAGKIITKGNIQPLITLGLGLNGDDSLIDNVITMLVLNGHSTSYAKSVAPSLIEDVGLSGFSKFQYKNLSSGMQMRANFSTQFFASPDILLLDEFFGAGDKDFIDYAREKLEKFVQSSGTFVFSSHSRELIERLVERIIVLEKGQIVFDGPAIDGVKFYWG